MAPDIDVVGHIEPVYVYQHPVLTEQRWACVRTWVSLKSSRQRLTEDKYAIVRLPDAEAIGDADEG